MHVLSFVIFCAFVDVCLFLLCIPFHVFVNICLSLFIMYAHVAYVCLYLLVCVPNYEAYICDFFRCVSGRVPCYGVERGVLVKNVHTPSFHFHPPTRKLGATPPQIQDAPGSNVRRAPLLLFRFISGYDHRYNISGYDTDGVKLVSFGA